VLCVSIIGCVWLPLVYNMHELSHSCLFLAMTERRSSFGYWLRRKPKALDLTQVELASRAGCVVTTIKKLETGTRRPSRQLVERLADALQLTSDERARLLAVAGSSSPIPLSPRSAQPGTDAVPSPPAAPLPSVLPSPPAPPARSWEHRWHCRGDSRAGGACHSPRAAGTGCSAVRRRRTIRASHHAPIWPAERFELDRHTIELRSRLPAPIRSQLWREGQAFSIEKAIAYARADGAARIAPKPTSRIATLTERERQVAALIARGMTNRAIAEALVISERTVERHVANMFAKLDVGSRAQIAAFAVEEGLTHPSV
jgi:DNA-binding CsgD family transcriptional regulator/transcriptional regulator with XRE-family HTH domain